MPKALSDDPLAYLPLVFVGLIVLGAVVRLIRPLYERSRWKLPVTEFFRSYRLFLACVLAGFVATLYFGGDLVQAKGADLEADMQITAGPVIGAYLNDTDHPPRQIPTIVNARNTYRFERIPGSLKYIRIDPSTAPGAKISIYSVSVISEGRLVKRFSPAELKAWTLYNLVPTDGDPEAYNLTTINTSMGTFLASPVSIEASPHPGWLLYMLDKFQAPHFYSLALLVFFLLFLASGLSSADGMIDAAIVGAVAILAPFVARLASKFPASPPDIASAVGKSSYIGYPKFDDHLISWCILGMCVALAFVAARFSSGPRKSRPIGADTGRPLTAYIGPAAMLVFLTLLFTPDLRIVFDYLQQVTYRPIHWDYANFLFWQYLGHHGYLPFRDYWYPYAGFYTGSLPFPAGYTWTAVENILALWFLYMGMRSAVGKRAAFLVFIPVLVGVGLNEFLSWNRYSLGITVILFSIGAQRTECFRWRQALLFAAASSFMFFFEPTQLIYAGGGILAYSAVHALLDARDGPNWTAIRVRLARMGRQWVVCVLMPMAAGSFVTLCWYTIKGMLPGFIRFHLSLSDQYVTAAIPADVFGWSLPALRFETMFMLVFFVLVLALYAIVRDRQSVSNAYVAAAVVAFAGLMAMQKNIMRPPILEQVQIYPWIAALLYGVAAWPHRTRLQTVTGGLFLGLILGVAEYDNVMLHDYRALVNGPSILRANYHLVQERQDAIRAVNATLYAGERFTGFPQQKAVLDVLKAEFGWNAPNPVFVLGDDQVFYMLIGGSFPYVANNYNGASLSEEAHTLQWIQEQKPRFVIWNPSMQMFDDVPDVVRVPLLFQFVREHYRFVKTVGPYDILLASDEQPADAVYWIQRLSRRIELGSVPRLTKASWFGSCPTSRPNECQLVAVVRLQSPHPGKAVLTIDSTDGPFELGFDVAEGRKVYVFDLDRLWFRHLLKANTAVHVSIPAAVASVEARLRDQNVLY